MEKSRNRLVCFFDSGIGGINLLYEGVRSLPRVDFTYFADNFRVPYGSMTSKELLLRVDEIFSRIDKLNPAAAVVACNTVTAQCIKFLRAKYGFEIIGIQPAIKPAAAAGKKVLVLATPSTAESASMKELIENYGGNNCKVVACPDLAAFIEKNIENISPKEIEKLLPHYNADSVVLGCTHYIFVKEIIKKYYNCPVFDGVEGTIARLCEKLGNFDHFEKRAQKVRFKEGDFEKNLKIFQNLIKSKGGLSQAATSNSQKI